MSRGFTRGSHNATLVAVNNVCWSDVFTSKASERKAEPFLSEKLLKDESSVHPDSRHFDTVVEDVVGGYEEFDVRATFVCREIVAITSQRAPAEVLRTLVVGMVNVVLDSN